MTTELTGRAVDDSRPIDITFDFRSDTPPGKDPDTRSPTLRRYHKRLWSKPLPCGVLFELVDTTPGVYLHHHSPQLGQFWLASDAVVPTFRKEARLAHVIGQGQKELATFADTWSSSCFRTLSLKIARP